MSIRTFIKRTQLLLEQGLYESRRALKTDDESLRAPDIRQLEQRILLSASPAVVVAEAANAASGTAALDTFALTDQQFLDVVADSVLPQPAAEIDSVSVEVAPPIDSDAAMKTLELVFIDSNVSNIEQMIADLQSENQLDDSRTLEVVVLDSEQDGIAQITSTLLQYNGVDGVHIVSHGNAGQVQLGSTTLSLDNLDTYRAAISAWQFSLSEEADLLLYGCNLAATTEGQELIAELAAACDCDVAASSDNTGHAALGGDWDLEFTVGQVEIGSAFSEVLQQQWNDLLNVTIDNTSTGTSSGGNISVSHTTAGANRLMLVGISINEASDESVVSVSYNGDALSYVGSAENGDARVEIWSLLNPDAVTANVDVVFSGTTDGNTVGVVTFNGVDQITALGTWSSGTGGSGGGGGVTVASAADELAFAVISVDDPTDYDLVPDGGQTELWDLAGGPNVNGGGSTTAGAAFVPLSWTWSGSDPWAIVGVSIKPVIPVTTVTVDTTADYNSGHANYGDTSSIAALIADSGADGLVSLREAIDAANNQLGTDTITFDITGAGPHTINLLSTLPTITDTLFIDGWSEPDWSSSPVVRIDGNGAGGNGLTFADGSDGSTVRGLMITRFGGSGVHINSGADGITLHGNWIGTTGTGSTGVGNSNDGIDTRAASTYIGGTGLNEGNVITNSGDEGINLQGSGVTAHQILGNIIGLDPDGSTGSGNSDVGIAIISGSGNTIGGTTAAARNIISMNFEGIEINTDNNIVQGNYIGTDIGGTLDRGNRSDDGVEIQNSASGNLIGGTENGAGNLIAFNALDGVSIKNGVDNAVLGNQIFSNSGLGIDLGTSGVTGNDTGDGDSGANDLQNFAVLTTAVTTGAQITISGSLNSTASSYYRVEFFASTNEDATGFGEGQTYLGFVNVTTNGSGDATFNTSLATSVAVGSFISVTTTRSDAAFTTFTDSSEFGANILATNTAPTLDATKSPVLTPVDEDAGAPSGAVGTLISELVDFATPSGQVDNVTDADSGAGLGIAVTAVDTSNGVWFYSTDDGSNWNTLGAVSDSSARLLAADANTRIYFQANTNYRGTLASAITFRAWDQSAGSNGSLADTTANGGTSAFSTATDVAALTVTAVNDAPVLDNSGTPSLPTITKSQTNNGGQNISAIVGSAGGDRITDADSGAVEGIAITALASGNGAWEYSTDGGIVWNAVGAVSNSSALLLRGTDLVRFVPNGVTPTTASFDFVAWDQTTGTAATKVDVSTGGGTTAFSTATETANINVIDVNTAPVLDSSKSPALTAIYEDPGAPSGAVGSLVSTLVDPATPSGQVDNVTDVDSGAGLGIAVTAADTTDGTWFYSIDNGSTWNSLGAVSDTNARLLAANASTRLYFQANANYHGTLPAAITFRAWDQTSGTNGSLANLTVTSTVLDNFSTVSYTNNDGTTIWNSNWIEVGDNGGASNGGFKVNNSNELQLSTDTASDFIYRDADLSDAMAATLSFAYNNPLSSSRQIEVQISSGGSYSTLFVFDDSTNTGSGTKSIDIAPWMSSSTRIRMIVTDDANGGTTAMTFDDVQIQYTTPGGGSSAFSTASDTTSLVVNPVADTPSITNATTNEDTQSTSGLVITRNAADGAEVTHYKIIGIADGTLYKNDGVTQITDGSFITIAEGTAGLKFTPTADFNGTGNFTIQASTSNVDGGLGGSTVAATITVTPVNDEQVLATSTGTTVNEASTGNVVTTAMLETTDVDNTAAQLTYTVTTATGNGTLKLSGTALAVSDTFTQADIDGGLVTYDHDGSETVSDSFAFDVDDAAGTSSSGTFNFTVTPVNDEEVLATNTGTTVNEASSSNVLTTAMLETTDVDNTSGQLTYTITTATANGTLRLSGTALGVSDTFTQADIDGGLVTYDHDGSETLSDSFNFSVDDGLGPGTNGAFNLTISAINDAPLLVTNNPLGVPAESSRTITTAFLEVTDADNTRAEIVYTLTELPSVPGDTAKVRLNGTDLSVGQTFTQDDIDNNRVTFRHNDDPHATSFKVTVSDGTATLPEITFSINGPGVNDSPSIAVNTGMGVNEGSGSNTITTAMLNEGDPDDAGVGLTYTITTTTTNGTMRLSGTAIGVSDTFTQDDVDNNRVTYDHNGSETVADSFDFSLADGGEDGAVAAIGTFSISVTQVNDEEVLATNTGATVNEASTGNVVTTAMLETTDVDNTAAQLTYTVTTATGNGTLRLSGTALAVSDTFTQADIDGGLVTYDHNGSETVSDSFDFSVDDAAGTNSSGTFNFTVTPVNDIPTFTTFAAPVDSTNEDTEVEISFADLAAQGNEADVDGTIDAFIVKSIASGTLKIGTSAGTATAWAAGTNDTIDATNHAYWTPAADVNGTQNAFDVVAEDNQGAESASNITAQVSVTAVNDAPLISALSGDDLTYTAGDGAVLIEQGGDVVVSDIDSGDFDSGSLTASLTSGSDAAQDVLSIRNEGNGAGQIGFDGSNVTYGGTLIGTATGGSAGSDLVVTLNTSANSAAMSALIRNITYENTDTVTPTTGARQVSFSINDGDGATSVNYDTTVNLPGVNTATVLDRFGTEAYSNNDGSVNWTGDWVETDSNGGGAASGRFSVRPTQGDLYVVVHQAGDNLYREADLSAATSATLSLDHDNKLGGGATLHLQASGDGGSNYTTVAVFDASTNQGVGSLSIDITSYAAANTQLRLYVVAGETGAAQNKVSIDNIAVNYTYNTDPVLSLPGAAVSYTENDGSVLIDAAATVSDAANTNFDTGVLTVDFTAGSTANDRLAIRNQGSGPGQVGVTASDVTYGGSIVGTFSGGTDGSTPLSVTFNNSADRAAVEAVVRNITYENVSEDPTATARTVRFVLTDGDGGTSSAVSETVNVSSVNDAPTLTSFAAVIETTNEDTEVEISFADLTAQGNEADVDGTVDAFVVTSITSGTLKIGTSAGTATAWAAGTNDTIDATNRAYWTPANNANGTQNAFQVVAQDDDGATSASNVTVQVSVTDVNDIPTLTNFAAAVDTTNEDTEVELTFAELTSQGNESDLDGTVDAFVVTSITSGTLRIGTSAGTATAWAAGTNDTIDATNRAYWTPANNANGTQNAFHVVAQDDDGAISASNVTVQVSVTDANDIPTLTTFTAPVDTTSEDTEVELTFAELAAQGDEADIDGTVDAFVVTNITSGTLKIGTSAGTATAWAASTNDTIDATNKAYWTPANNANGTQNAFQVVAQDDDGATSASNVTVQVSVTPVNDAPITSITAESPNFTEGDSAVSLFRDAAVDAVEVGDAISSVVISVDGLVDGADEKLVVDGIDINLTDGNVQTTYVNGYDVNVDVTGTMATVTISRGVPIAVSDSETLLNSLAYNNTSQAVQNGTRTVTFESITDNGGGTATSVNGTSSVVTVNGQNDAPTLTGFAAVVDTTNEGVEAQITFAELAAQGDEADVDGTVDAFEVRSVASGTLRIGTSAGTATAWAAGTNDTIDATHQAYWTPADNAHGTLDALTVVAIDNDGAESSGNVIVQVMVAPVNDQPRAADDRPGIAFDGIDDFISVGPDSALEMTSAVTLEAWVNPNVSATTWHMIINREGEYEVALAPDGTVYWAFGGTDPSWGWHDTGTAVAFGEWSHVAVTYDNGDVTTYVNGVSVDFYDGSGVINDAHVALDDFRIGGRSNNPSGQYFDGRIADVRVWDIARTGTAIAADRNALLTGTETGLVGYWRLDENSGSIATDLAGANDGTLTNGAAWSGHRIDENAVLNVTSPGVLANDFDVDGDILTVSEVEGNALNVGQQIILSSGASLTLNADGSFTYDTNAAFDYLGPGSTVTDSFNYTVTDGTLTDTAAVTILIDGNNDAPTISAIGDQTTPEDTATGPVTFTVGDAESAAGSLIVTASSDDQTLIPNGNITLSGTGTNRTINLQPTANQIGGPVTITVTVDDGTTTSSETFTVSVTAVNDSPTGSVTIDNTTPAQGDTLTAANTLADADGLGTITWQWQRDGLNISGATGTIYTTVQADVDRTITVLASYTDGHGTSESVASAATAAVTNVNDVPSGVPTITGTATEDQILTANTSGISDADGLGTFSYQWLRNGLNINAATSQDYLLGDADVGQFISVQVTWTDGYGTDEGPLTSAQTAAIVNVNDAPTITAIGDQTIAEDTTTGPLTFTVSDVDTAASTLTVTASSSNLTVIPNSNLTLVDLGSGNWTLETLPAANQHGGPVTITVTVNDGTTTTSETFDVTVTPTNDLPVGLPVIIGTPAEDQTLTADTSGISDVDGTGPFSHQWLRNGTLIVGATSPTYTLGDADVGAQISVQVHYTDGQATAEGPLTSATTAVVANVNDTPVGSPSINGIAQQYQTLTVDTTGIHDNDGLGTLNYQWLRDGVAIVGATTNTYTLAQNDVSAGISVQVSWTDANGTQEGPVLSTLTTPVANVNDAPLAVGEHFSGNQLQNLTVAAGVLTANDIDPDGDALTVVLATGPEHGQLTLNADGSFTYAPTGAFSGQDSFTYLVSDGTLFSNIVTVSLDLATTVAGSGDTDAGHSTDAGDYSGDTGSGTDSAASGSSGTGTGNNSHTANAATGNTAAGAAAASRHGAANTGQANAGAPAVQHQSVDLLAATNSDLFISVNLEDVPDSSVLDDALRSDRTLAQESDTHRSALSSEFLVTQITTNSPLFAHGTLKLNEQPFLQQKAQDDSSDVLIDRVVVGTTAAVSTSVSVGYVVWMLRGGTLLTTFLSSMPAWQAFDPLPVLESFENEDPDDDESLSSMISGD